VVQTGSGAHTTFFPAGAVGSFPGGQMLQGRAADLSPPPIRSRSQYVDQYIRVRNTWFVTPRSIEFRERGTLHPLAVYAKCERILLHSF
jgi:hypothetical protein